MQYAHIRLRFPSVSAEKSSPAGFPAGDALYFEKLLFCLDRSLSGGESCDGNTERAAGNVAQTDVVAELHGGGVAALLAADAQLDVRAGLTAKFGSHLDEAADAGLIQLGERIGLVDLAVIVGSEELARVVTAEAVGQLGQVVGAEAEELSFFCHFVGGEASSKKTSSVANFLSWYHILEHMKNKA